MNQRYELIEAHPYFCVPACISMILSSTGEFVSQHEIARHLSICVPPNVPMSTPHQVSDELLRHGAISSLDSIAHLLEELGFAFDLERTFSQEHMDWIFEDIIKEAEQDFHIVALLDHGVFRHSSPSSLGHAVLIDKYVGGDSVSIFDPGPNPTEVMEVSLPLLRAATLARDDGGLLILKKKINL